MGISRKIEECPTCKRPEEKAVTYTCDRCGKKETVEQGGVGPDNYLILRLDGGYGMFVDPEDYWGSYSKKEWDERNQELVKTYCHNCGHIICQELGIETKGFHTDRDAPVETKSRNV